MTRTERTYYVVFSLFNLSWSVLGPIYALFLLSRGLDLFEVNAVLATYLITAFVFEVPTGAFADVVGRKRSFLLSCAVRSGAFLLYWFAHSFAGFLIAEAVDAIGTTLASGALDAWAVDGMAAEGHALPPARFFPRAQMISRTVMIASGLAGAHLGQIDLAWPWLMGATGFVLTGIVAALTMREPPLMRSASVRPSFVRAIRDGLTTVRTAPVLLLLCALTLTGAFSVMPVYQLWQPRMQALTGEGVWLMGWIWALLNVAGIVGSALIPRLLGQFDREYVLCAVTLWRGVTVGVAALAVGFSPALAGLLLFELGRGVGEPLVQAWTNEHIAAEQRATVLSVQAMCFTLGGGTGLLCIGLAARAFGISAGWLGSAILLSVTAPGFLILGRLAQRAPRPAGRSEPDLISAG